MPSGFSRRALSVLLACVAVVAAAGCGSGDEEIDAVQVVGVWEGDGGGRVTFHRDGRFEMSGIPREAIVFSFIDPPPGDGKISGKGNWEMDGGEDRASEVILYVDKGGSYSDDTEVEQLRVEDGGRDPVMFFQVNVDKEYGYEIRRVESAPPRD